jgi:hypothetical protein
MIANTELEATTVAYDEALPRFLPPTAKNHENVTFAGL